ncbi:amidohydrolase family protein [Pseudonocardia asaccharolytica]|uniref:Amidohydrolase n=1 Tax=Pseudonocardia asaccharolytica DSM 44247 = NBRC 16224 TaxID=1123024 RepID=A0A511CZQ1_9PSEU|nr:amidohydrolase family protein [Pseudonocardia asaccharolytica]GEL18019.1 amidohydrolase [Pseudonocardia asaccharolytica DSM 44247 = NBRC 16224]
MYHVASERYAVVDAQVHAWDGSPHNQAGPSGEEFVAELYRRHRLLDRMPRPVTADEFARVTEAGLTADVLGGHVDRGVLQPVALDELFVLGFSPTTWHAEFAELLPGRFVLTGELDPSLGSAGARGLAARVRNGDLRGLHLAPARRPTGRLGLAEPWLRRVLARCEQSGAAVVHLGVGPSAPAGADEPDWMVRATTGSAADGPRWPQWADPVRAGSALPVRTRAARRPAGIRFDPAELGELARALPRVQFVLGAACLPTARLCRLARLPNVHVLLTDLLAGLRIRPLPAARALGTLLEAFGGDRLLFGSGYPLMRPGRLVEEFATFRFPAQLRGGFAELDAVTRHAILGGNAARLYRIPLPAGTTAPQLPLRRPGAGS